MDSSSLDELIAQFSTGQPVRDAWASFNALDPHDLFCDQFSLRVARRYITRELAYWPADRAMNALYIYCYHLDEDRGMPDFSWLVFNTFEEGEYVHRGDSADTIPDEKYVRPAIQRLLSLAR